MAPLPNALSGAAQTVDSMPVPATAAGARTKPTSDGFHGRIHAVPVIETVSKSGKVAEALYRALEITMALAGLLVGLPFILVAAVLVRLDSPGPIFFRHRRPARSAIVRGRDLMGRSDLIPPPGGYDPDAEYYVPQYFTLVKFRTMYDDARVRFPAFYAYKYTAENFHEQFHTIQYDPRVTRVGRILRKLSVDELPNLWSVLVGDMRLVGPRPEAPEVLQYYSQEEMYKFACKPGVTGLSSINGRGLLTWGETIRWDLQYVHTRTVWLDIKIILLTLRYVITRRGAF